MLTSEQRQARHEGIGGSEAAAALGLSPWSSPFELYQAKRAPLPEDDASKPWLRWGHLLEPVIRDEYARVRGVTVTVPQETLRHPKHTFMVCHPDGIASNGVLYEGKIARMSGPEWGEAGTDQVPLPYLLQVQHNLAVTGLDEAELAVLIGNSDFRIYTIRADAELQGTMAEAEAELWQRILDGRPPDPDWQNPRALGVVKAAYPGTNGQRMTADETLERWRFVYDEAKARAKHYDAAASGAMAHLLYTMGEAAELAFADGKVLRRKLVKRKGYTIEATTAMDVRFVNDKGGKDDE